MKQEKIFLEVDKLERRVEGKINMLKAYKESFTVVRTTYTTVIKPNKGEPIKYIAKGNDFSPADLSFIGQVQNHFKKIELPKQIRPQTESLRYFQNYTGISAGVYPDFAEVDVSAAYWEAANKLGYLSEKIYNKGMFGNVSKKSRLVALGALGKRMEVERWEPPYDDIQKITTNPVTKVFWDNICWTFGIDMKSICDQFPEGDIMGYWVDALFVRKSRIAEVKKLFMEKGYEVKIVPWKIIELRNYMERANFFQIIRVGEDGKEKELPPFEVDKVGREKKGQSISSALKKLEEMIKLASESRDAKKK